MIRLFECVTKLTVKRSTSSETFTAIASHDLPIGPVNVATEGGKYKTIVFGKCKTVTNW